jgi:uncharacterized protein (TIGR01370 family)
MRARIEGGDSFVGGARRAGRGGSRSSSSSVRHLVLPLRALVSVAALVCILAPSVEVRAADAPHVATAFFYGDSVPRELLDHFDRVVVEADAVSGVPRGGRARVFAYVSVGEVHPSRSWRKDVPDALILGSNAAWGSDVVDTRSPAWREFLLGHVIDPLYERGYRGVFLDTLDSYRAWTRDPAERDRHAAGLAAIVAGIRGRHADMQILMNRGFEVLPLLAAPPDGLVVESLFRTADARGRDYHEVPAAESEALLQALRDVRSRWPIPITVIDYVPPSDRALRRATALRIWDAGFDPYVATPSLDGVGVGRVEIIPRRVLLLYKDDPDAVYLGQQDACVLLAPVLEWMGYAIDYVDVRGALPEGDIAGRYAGVVTLVAEGVPDPAAYQRWIARQLDSGVRFAFLDGFGFDPDASLLERLGLSLAKTSARPPVRLSPATPYIGFEAPARARNRELPPVVGSSPEVRSLLRVEDADESAWDGIVVGPWGGAAFAPFFLEQGLEQERRWILDPFQFLRDALALAPIPAPDVTTESGRRILTIHVDGDAFVSHAERRDAPFAGQVILDEILSRYPVPQTVSVVEGEVGPAGLYPQDSPKLEAIAREIFKLPYVEAGSHTFSHPFVWSDAEAGRRTSPAASLPIPNYAFSMDRDLRGSIEYMQSRLLPPGKKVRVLQWSGDCAPSSAVVAYVERLGIENVNGGGSTRTADFPSLTRGSALGIPKGGGVYQVFAPVENENVYANDWQGPFYGYEHVIETFELNERPRRLSTIAIYYHFYTGTKTASLVALRRVYDWAMQQPTTRLFLSEYAAKVRAFQNVTLGRRIDDGGWEVAGLGELRTLRVDRGWGWPDLVQSSGIAGVRDDLAGRYLHVARDADPVIYPESGRPSAPYLESANGRVLRWSRTAKGWAVRLAGHEPLILEVANAQTCTLRTAAGSIAGARAGATVRLAVGRDDTGEATLECR